ncbi:MAG: N-acetylglucosamine-6-phosphate deacetylase [Firmicutes bacterium]|nr:N-acetylglucosamine-6-phosphate deacetylase [Bacillota bacterium]
MIYKNAKVNGQLVDIQVTEGKIAGIGHYDGEGTDLAGAKVYPGLVDVHSHGCMGHDTMDGAGMDVMCQYMAQNGVTSWLATTMTMDMETIKKITDVLPACPDGTQVLGYHLEGPYINARYKGAQNGDYIIPPSLEEFCQLQNILLVTVAPEVTGAMDFIEKCPAVVALGHTAADYGCASEAMERGAKCLTHTFNAMPGLHHRDPGPVGAAMDKKIYVQVISDGIHIHPGVVRMLYKVFGAQRMVLISDSMRATGLSDGEYDLGGQLVYVKEGKARLADGTIAGSTSNLMQCVRKAIEFGVTEEDAFKMASQTPCEMLGLNKGKLAVGYDADFVVVDDQLAVQKTIIGGKVVYEAE